MIEYERKALQGVPDYRAAELLPKRSEYCLLIPVINEGARILTELGRAQTAGVDTLCDIVICDGGSTDGSMKLDTLQLYGVNTLLTKIGPGKQGAQLRMGIYFALNRGYKGVLTIDGNNKDSIEDAQNSSRNCRQAMTLCRAAASSAAATPSTPRRCATPPCGWCMRRSSAWGRTSGSPIRPTPTAPTAAST